MSDIFQTPAPQDSPDSPNPPNPSKPPLPLFLLWIRRLPARLLLIGAALVFAVWSGARWVERSFQSVAPGEAGLVVSRFTGGTRIVAPGRHFLPGAFYVLTRMSVSDQLLSGPSATFTVPTRDGFAVGLVIQARWALDRNHVLVGDLKLPVEFERGRLALLGQSQLVERTEANLRFKKQEIEQQRLAAEARKARRLREAESAAQTMRIQTKEAGKRVANGQPALTSRAD